MLTFWLAAPPLLLEVAFRRDETAAFEQKRCPSHAKCILLLWVVAICSSSGNPAAVSSRRNAKFFFRLSPLSYEMATFAVGASLVGLKVAFRRDETVVFE